MSSATWMAASSRTLRPDHPRRRLARRADRREPSWGSTFWSHLDLAIKLHQVHTLIVIDHRDCGAYKLLFGEDYSLDPVREREAHAEQMRQLRDLVTERHPSLPTELLLMSLDGSVETIS